MFAAIDAQILLTEGCVDEITMMRLGRIRMSIGPVMLATDAHALDGDGVTVLQLADHGDQEDQKLLLIGIIEGSSRLPYGASSRIARPDSIEPGAGDADAQSAAVIRIGAFFDQGLALERQDGIGCRGLGDVKLLRQKLDGEPLWTPFEHIENGQLGWIDAGSPGPRPVIGAQGRTNAGKAFKQAYR